jgi:hypothetical protein
MTYTEHAGKESLTISKRVIRIRISKKDRKHKWPQYLIRFIVLVVEEAGVPGENHRPWASNWQALSLAAASRVHHFL